MRLVRARTIEFMPDGSRLVVMGSCGAWPEPGQACSGFVLEHAGFRVVLDLGYGTYSRLAAHTGSLVGRGIDAVVVTHQHPDHMVDLHALFRARWFGSRDAAPLPLYAGAGVVERLQGLEGDDREVIEQVFEVHDLPGGPFTLGPFELTSVALPHFVPNAGVRLVAPGLVVAYTGDTGPDPALAELGRDADLFVAEASGRDQQASTPLSPEGPAFHLNSREAGQAAAEAGAHRLLLTHFWPGNDRERSRDAAAEVYDGEVLIATEGLSIPLQPRQAVAG